MSAAGRKAEQKSKVLVIWEPRMKNTVSTPAKSSFPISEIERIVQGYKALRVGAFTIAGITAIQARFGDEVVQRAVDFALEELHCAVQAIETFSLPDWTCIAVLDERASEDSVGYAIRKMRLAAKKFEIDTGSRSIVLPMSFSRWQLIHGAEISVEALCKKLDDFVKGQAGSPR